MAIANYFWETSNSGFAKREEKDGLLMHVPIPAVFSLFILPFSFFLSFFLSVLLLLVSYYSLAVSYSPFGLFFSWVHLYRCLLLSYHGFFPLGAPAPLGPPFSAMVISSFYSELMQ